MIRPETKQREAILNVLRHKNSRHTAGRIYDDVSLLGVDREIPDYKF